MTPGVCNESAGRRNQAEQVDSGGKAEYFCALARPCVRRTQSVRGKNETDVPTQHAQAQTQTRLPRPHANTRRTGDSQCAPQKGPEPTHSLRPDCGAKLHGEASPSGHVALAPPQSAPPRPAANNEAVFCTISKPVLDGDSACTAPSNLKPFSQTSDTGRFAHRCSAFIVGPTAAGVPGSVWRFRGKPQKKRLTETA